LAERTATAKCACRRDPTSRRPRDPGSESRRPDHLRPSAPGFRLSALGADCSGLARLRLQCRNAREDYRVLVRKLGHEREPAAQVLRTSGGPAP